MLIEANIDIVSVAEFHMALNT